MKRKQWWFVVRQRLTDKPLREVKLTGSTAEREKQERALWCGVDDEQEYWDVEERRNGGQSEA